MFMARYLMRDNCKKDKFMSWHEAKTLYFQIYTDKHIDITLLPMNQPNLDEYVACQSFRWLPKFMRLVLSELVVFC